MNVKKEKNTIKTIERSIAVYILILGILFFSIGIWSLWTRIDIINAYDSELKLQISFTKIFKNYHLGFILSLIQIIGGLTLLLGKRIGYYLTLYIFLNYVIHYILNFIFIDSNGQLETLIVQSIFGLIDLTCVLLLLLPTIRKVYSVTKNHLFIILILNILCELYRFWLN